jgi:hypothetical protein
MSFLGDTILVPEHGALPNNFAFFKVIKKINDDTFVSDDILAGKHIVVTRKEHYYPITATILFSHLYDTSLSFLVMGDKEYAYTVNTTDHYIIESDPVEGRVLNPKLENIGDAEEDALIEQLRRDPSLAERIPQVLWKRPRFQKKILSANLPLESDLVPENVKTMARMKRLHFLGKTGTFDHDKLPDVLSDKVNDYLGIEVDPQALQEARVAKSKRTKCKQSCAVSGGTRKNKRKRYGRV